MLSNGDAWSGPRPLKRLLKTLARLRRGLSRKKKGSKNREKAKLKVAKLQSRIANIRRDSLHKLTTSLVQRFSLIGIEDLNVRGMMANHCLARSIADMGFYEFRRQLGYKAKWYACQVVPIGRFEPSSKKCCDDIVAKHHQLRGSQPQKEWQRWKTFEWRTSISSLLLLLNERKGPPSCGDASFYSCPARRSQSRR